MKANEQQYAEWWTVYLAAMKIALRDESTTRENALEWAGEVADEAVEMADTAYRVYLNIPDE